MMAANSAAAVVLRLRRGIGIERLNDQERAMVADMLGTGEDR
jgi:hypothetical protein